MKRRGDNRGARVRRTGFVVGALVLGAAVTAWSLTRSDPPGRSEVSPIADPEAAQSESEDLSPSPRDAGVRTALSTSDDVAGSVSFDDGMPCRGGRIVLVTANGHHSASPTDNHGEFRLRVPHDEATAELELVAPGTIPLHHSLRLDELARDARGVRVIHLRALRRITVRVTVDVDPSIAPWIGPGHRVRLAIRRASLVAPNGLEAVPSSEMQTVPIYGTNWPITFTADEDPLRGHRGWVVNCDLAERWPVHWCEVPVTLSVPEDEQSTTSVRITLDGSRVLRGTITSDDGVPLSSGRVVYERSGREAAFCYSAPDGRFLLPLPGGSDGELFVEFGSVRAGLGPRLPGDDLGVVVIAIPECIRVRLVDPQRHPISSYFVGYSNLHRRPSELAAHLVDHPGGVAVLRSRALARGDRLFFEGSFGQMVFEVSEELRGGSSPIEIVAVPSPTGNLRLEGLATVAKSTSVELREVRAARRYSDNRSYVTTVDNQDGTCLLEDLATGDYEYTVRVGSSVTAQGFVRVHQGENTQSIR